MQYGNDPWVQVLQGELGARPTNERGRMATIDGLSSDLGRGIGSALLLKASTIKDFIRQTAAGDSGKHLIRRLFQLVRRRIGEQFDHGMECRDRRVLNRIDERLEKHRREVAKQVQRQVDACLEKHRSHVDEQVRRHIDERLGAGTGEIGSSATTFARTTDRPPLRASPKAVLGGKRLLLYLVELCRLKPTHAVLEVGCGGGGPALALTEYLGREGRYEGLDIQPEKISRCTEIITARYPNFRFQVADVFNGRYNPTGKFQPSEYKFPFQDSSFDIVLLGSVFTHMLPKDVENYIAEISRVLKSKAKCLITYFLLNPETIQRIEDGKSHKKFAYDFGNYRAVHKEHPERVVGLYEDSIRSWYDKYGLQVLEPIHYGRWSGRKQALSNQDIIVAVKT